MRFVHCSCARLRRIYAPTRTVTGNILTTDNIPIFAATPSRGTTGSPVVQRQRCSWLRQERAYVLA